MRRYFLALLLLMPLSGQAVIDQVSWAATRIVRVDGREFVTRVHHTPTRERISAVVGGMDLTLIVRSDRNLLWQLMPALGMYGETDISGMDTPLNIRILSRERLGEEHVGGQSAIKYRANFETAGGVRRQGYYWENPAGVHLRSQFSIADRNGVLRQVTLELREVQVGTQPTNLFEVPEGYYRVPLDAAVLLNLLGV